MQKTINFAKRLGLASSDVYMVALLFYFVLRQLFSTSIWYTALMSDFLQWLLLPSFVLCALLYGIGQRLRAALMLVFPLIFLYLFGGLFIPNMRGAHAENSTQLRVMTYNVASDGFSPDELVKALRDSEADIIALQELGPWQAAVLENTLLEEYPHRVLSGAYIKGKGLLSRYPIQDYEFLDTIIQRPNLLAHIQVEDRLLTVFVVHPPAPGFQSGGKFYGDDPDHASDIRTLLTFVSPDEPTLVLGDFNMTDQNPSYKTIKNAGFADSFRAVGWGFGATFPSRHMLIPLVRIDYIWSSPHLKPLHSHVGEDAGSDHMPLISEFAWEKES